MAKKNKKKNQEAAIENYYDLKVDKIDELVAALKDEESLPDEPIDYGMNTNMGVNDPKNYKRSGKEKQFDPYKTDFLSKVPVWIKALFVKWWFAGMVCWFFVFGIQWKNILDTVIFVGLALGIVVDLLVNPVLHYMQTDKKEYDNYMMFPFPFKAFWTFFANVSYYILIMIGVFYIYQGLGMLVSADATSAFPIEPLLFGTFCVIVDMIFIGIKDGVVALVRHLKKSKKENAVNV